MATTAFPKVNGELFPKQHPKIPVAVSRQRYLLNVDEINRYHLAAIPPCRRFETRGFPSLSIPPETVSPSVVPSFFISSTTVQPRNSSEKQVTAGHRQCFYDSVTAQL